MMGYQFCKSRKRNNTKKTEPLLTFTNICDGKCILALKDYTQRLKRDTCRLSSHATVSGLSLPLNTDEKTGPTTRFTQINCVNDNVTSTSMSIQIQNPTIGMSISRIQAPE